MGGAGALNNAHSGRRCRKATPRPRELGTLKQSLPPLGPSPSSVPASWSLSPRLGVGTHPLLHLPLLRLCSPSQTFPEHFGEDTIIAKGQAHLQHHPCPDQKFPWGLSSSPFPLGLPPPSLSGGSRAWIQQPRLSLHWGLCHQPLCWLPCRQFPPSIFKDSLVLRSLSSAVPHPSPSKAFPSLSKNSEVMSLVFGNNYCRKLGLLQQIVWGLISHDQQIINGT